MKARPWLPFVAFAAILGAGTVLALAAGSLSFGSHLPRLLLLLPISPRADRERRRSRG